MRRVYILIGIWFALAGTTIVAFGDPLRVKIENPPTTVVAGQPYVVNVIVTKYGRRVRNAHPVVIVRWPGGSFAYRASNVGHDGIYRVRVRVPLPGTLPYDVKVNGRLARQGTLASKLVSP